MTTALALPNEAEFRADIQAINQFQKVVRANMVDGQDYGIIPGTSKPTLLKPGAEKIAKLLGLADLYEIMDRQEDWQAGFFRYLIKCKLVSVGSGVLITEGFGECNSKESKYAYRWVFHSQLPQGYQSNKEARDKLTQKEIMTKNGKAKQYRLDNEDIYSQVNTILKMAKKRALVDAALSAGRLSQVFTQDIEDIAVIHDDEPVVKPAKVQTPKAKLDDSELPQPGAIEKVAEAVNVGRDPETIQTFNDLYRACSEDFTVLDKEGKPKKMQPFQVIAELGVSSQSDVSDSPAECYRQIAAVRQS